MREQKYLSSPLALVLLESSGARAVAMESSWDTSHVPAPTRARAEGGDAVPLHRGQRGAAGTPGEPHARDRPPAWWPRQPWGSGGCAAAAEPAGLGEAPGEAPREPPRSRRRGLLQAPFSSFSKGNGRFPKLHKIGFSDLIPEPGSGSDFGLRQAGLAPRRWAGGVAGERSTRSANCSIVSAETKV